VESSLQSAGGEGALRELMALGGWIMILLHDGRCMAVAAHNSISQAGVQAGTCLITKACCLPLAAGNWPPVPLWPETGHLHLPPAVQRRDPGGWPLGV
jgi:hypothetical protein